MNTDQTKSVFLSVKIRGPKRRGLRLRRALSGRTGRVDNQGPPSQLTSPGLILRLPSKTQDPGSGQGGILRMQVSRAATWVEVWPGSRRTPRVRGNYCRLMPQIFLKKSFFDHIDTCFTAARVRGDSINP
jgi:hypothetical protein